MNLREVINSFKNRKVLCKSIIKEAIENETDLDTVKEFLEILDGLVNKVDTYIYRELKSIIDLKIISLSTDYPSIEESNDIVKDNPEIKRFTAFGYDYKENDNIRRIEYIRYTNKEQNKILKIYEAYPGEFVNTVNSLGVNKLSNDALEEYFDKRNKILSIDDSEVYLNTLSASEEVKSKVSAELDEVKKHYPGDIKVTRDFIGNRLYIIGSEIVTFRLDFNTNKKVMVVISNNNEVIELENKTPGIGKANNLKMVVQKYLLCENLDDDEYAIMDTEGLGLLKTYNQVNCLPSEEEYSIMENYLIYLKGKQNKTEEEINELSKYNEKTQQEHMEQKGTQVLSLKLDSPYSDSNESYQPPVLIKQDNIKSGFSEAFIIIGTVIIVGLIAGILLIIK